MGFRKIYGRAPLCFGRIFCRKLILVIRLQNGLFERIQKRVSQVAFATEHSHKLWFLLFDFGPRISDGLVRSRMVLLLHQRRYIIGNSWFIIVWTFALPEIETIYERLIEMSSVQLLYYSHLGGGCCVGQPPQPHIHQPEPLFLSLIVNYWLAR